MTRRRLILADDHTMVRQGLHCLLTSRSDWQVVGEAEDGREAVDLALELLPDVVVMDVAMPTLNGIEATRQIKAQVPQVQILGMSVHADSRFVGQMLRSGASGYLLKDAAFEALIEALEVVASGQTYLTGDVAGVVVSHFVRGENDQNGSAYEALTAREREVLQLLSEGYASKQIARQLNISVKTIDTHRYQIMRKLKLRGLADLTRFALKEGISSLDADRVPVAG